MSAASSPRNGSSRPSLRRQLLLFLLIPLMLLLLLAATITYLGALAYSNHVHDRDLVDNTKALAQIISRQPVNEPLNAQARFLLEYDSDGKNYFSIRSNYGGLRAGSSGIPEPYRPPSPDRPPVLYDGLLNGKRRVRVANLSIHADNNSGEVLSISVAETLKSRRRRAREILLLTIPSQMLLILAVFALIWLGVDFGLRELQPLTRRLALREHDLAPIGESDVPIEVLPLTRTIDALFGRLRSMLALQERFIADAAHQLRTPLAGLRVHAERLQQAADAATASDAVQHIQRLTLRVSRTSTQLLALTRAQSINTGITPDQVLDLARLLPELVSLRVHEAIAAGIDLGYEEDSPGPLLILGVAAELQELLDNLIDNSLRYAGSGSIITVKLGRQDHDAVINVEDNGPGVPPAFLARLGERFFRVPGCSGEGSGLGLAIVQRIAQHHHAEMHFDNCQPAGFSVQLRFHLLSAEQSADASS